MISLNKKQILKNSYFIGILILFIFSNLISFVSIRNNRKLLKLLNYQTLNEQTTIKAKDACLVNQMRFDMSFSKMIKKKSCDTLLNHKSKVLLIFDGESACNSCILNILMDLNILADKIGRDNVVIAGDFNNSLELNTFLFGINDGFKSVLLKDIVDTKDYKISEPVLLVLEVDYDTKFIYFINNEDSDLTKVYIEDILTTYFLL